MAEGPLPPDALIIEGSSVTSGLPVQGHYPV
jgi:hypothetical protein